MPDGVDLAILQRATERDGWDDQGGVAVVATTWAEAHRMLSLIARQPGPALPNPFVSPCGDGSVHLTWRNRSGDRGVLEIGPAQAWWSLVAHAGVGLNGPVRVLSSEAALGHVLAFFG